MEKIYKNYYPASLKFKTYHQQAVINPKNKNQVTKALPSQSTIQQLIPH